MQRQRLYVHGSLAENVWLNEMAHRGWLLTAVQRFRYTFKKVTGFHHVFSEYVKQGPVDLKATNGMFTPITQWHMKNPDLWVVYSETTNEKVAGALHHARDPHFDLAIARVTRTRLLNVLNIWTYAWFGIGIILGTIGITSNTEAVSDAFLTLMLMCVVLMAFGMFAVYWPTSFVHVHVMNLTRETGDYDGTWLPTWHVMIEHTDATLDLDKLSYLGRWNQIVGDSKKKLYYYDLQTNASQRAINDAINHQL